MINEIVTATSGLARQQLDHESREIFEVALGHPGDSEGGHLFDEIVSLHGDIDYRMFLPGGKLLGRANLTATEHKEMVDFVRSTDSERIWLSKEDGKRQMRGLRRLTATESCTPCHRTGQVLAISSMGMDLTDLLDRVLNRGRRNMMLLIGFWATLLMLTTIVVRRSVRSSTERIEAELVAAGAGTLEDSESEPNLVLDSVSARLQVALRDFLKHQRKRQAEVADRLVHTDQLASLGQLAAGLAHEIKNPLAGIQGAVEILREDEDSGPTKQLYDEMLTELQRVNSTLHALLTSARPTPPHITEANALGLLEEVQRLLAPGLRRREIALETEFASADLLAPFDDDKIRQVLINLIQNAADAIEGGGRIRVSVMRCPDGTGAIFVVEDTGPGIPEEYQRRIFEPFFTTKFAGTGLGLAIARTLVEQHGGSLDFESKPGEGTTFYVILPESQDLVDEKTTIAERATTEEQVEKRESPSRTWP